MKKALEGESALQFCSFQSIHAKLFFLSFRFLVPYKLVGPSGSPAKGHYGKSWASEQRKVVAELKSNMAIINESLQDKKEIKELLQEINKSKKLSEGGEYFVNNEEKEEKRYLHSSRLDEEGEELLRPWIKTVECPVFERNDSSRLVSQANQTSKDQLQGYFF